MGRAGAFTGAAAEPRRVPGFVLPMITASVIGLDASLSAAAFIGAFYVREGASVLSPDAWAWSRAFVPYAGILYFAVVVRVLVLASQGAYRFQGAFSYSNEAIKIGKAIAIGSLFIVAWAFLFRGGFAFREFSYSRSVFLLDFGFAVVLIAGMHLAIRAAQSWIRRHDINLLPTLVVGTNAEAVRTVELLASRRDLGYRVVGVVSTGGEPDASLRVVGEIDQLTEIIRDAGAEEVIITDTNIDSSMLFEVMMQVGRRRRVEFRVAPTLFDLLPQKTSVEQVGVLPMVRLFREPLGDAERFVKRASDLVIATAAVIILLPLTVVIGLLIRLGSKGPVVFKQERVGMDGRVFLCYKFRTMFADVQIVEDLPVAAVNGAPLDGVIRPVLERFEFDVPLATRDEFVEVWLQYQINLYEPNGDLIVEWPVTGYGKAELRRANREQSVGRAAVIAMREVGAAIATQFADQPQVSYWLEERQDAAAALSN